MTAVRDVFAKPSEAGIDLAYESLLKRSREEPTYYISKFKSQLNNIKNILGDKFTEDHPTPTLLYRLIAQIEKEQGT